MTHSTKTFLLAAILFLLTASFIYADDNLLLQDKYESVFLLAQKLSSSEQNTDAALEYKRYLFLQRYQSGIHVEESLLALARYYESLGDINTALDYQTILCDTIYQNSLKESNSIPQNNEAQYEHSLQKEITLMRYRSAGMKICVLPSAVRFPQAPERSMSQIWRRENTGTGIRWTMKRCIRLLLRNRRMRKAC